MCEKKAEPCRPGDVLRARRNETEQSARRDAESVARLLVEEFGARRVWLFGSLATGRGFRRSSDIDLAVEGLDPRQLFRAVGRALQISSFPVDIKPFDELPKEWQRKILAEGRVLP
jgi:predicted nucleotidyltransferase